MKFLLFFSIVCAYITSSFQYYFGLKWGYCRHICTNNALKEEAQSIGYYWRDYNGVVPDDAWPAGKLNNGTTLYVGSVYDPANDGLFIVTIYEGVEYVLNTAVKASKLTQHIQILCTQEPEKFKFGYSGFKGWHIVDQYTVIGGEMPNHNGQSFSSYLAYVAKSPDSGLIGQLVFFPTGIEYTTPDGKNTTSTNYEFLTFGLPQNSAKDASAQNQKSEVTEPRSSPFTWHVERRKGGCGMLPNFFVQLKLGTCSSTCTNIPSRPETTYYWSRAKSQKRSPDALIGGHDYSGNDLLLYQSYESELNLLFTSANLSYTGTTYAKEGDMSAERYYIFVKVLSTPDKNNLKWVSVTSETVNNYKNVAVIGGGEPDGTTTYIGRATDKNAVIPGRVYIEENPRIVTSLKDYRAKTFQKFEILTFNKVKPSTLLNILLSFFDIGLILH